MTLGLEHGINRLVPYSAGWPGEFIAESQKIQELCADYILALEHVGSTSIPNMSAKPIIDMALGVASLNHSDLMIPAMESLGYDYPGDIGIPDDRIFGRDRGYRKFLIHAVEFNGPHWHKYLKFRDALRADAALADSYGNLKSRIVKEHPEGRAIYSELKSEFINRVLER